MKARVTVAATLAVIFTLSGCSSQYVMATKEGEMLLTQTKPVLDKETGMLSYIDEQGHEKQVNRNNISQIIQR